MDKEQKLPQHPEESLPDWLSIHVVDNVVQVLLHDADDGDDTTRDQLLCTPPTLADAEELVAKLKAWQPEDM